MLNEFRSRKIFLDGYRSSDFNHHIDGYIKWMTEKGYSRTTIHGYLGHIRAFAAFQKARRIKLAKINDEHVLQFLRWYQTTYKGPFARRTSHPHRMSQHQSAAIKSLLAFLRLSGVCKPAILAASPAIVDKYIEFLRVHRGLSELTIRNHQKRAIKFYGFLKNRSLNVDSMTMKAIEDFVMISENPSAPTARTAQVNFVRGFLRYLQANKIVPDTFQPFLPNRRRYADAAIPTVLAPGDGQKILKHVDRSTPTGKRDYAILQLLRTYGLRGGEVARLALDDIDWRAAVIRVKQTKTRRNLELPLLPPVARAILAYLKQGRPKSAKSRVLFLNKVAPCRGMTTGGIWHVAANSLARAGIKSQKRGSHIFRHTRATELLRQGEPLKSIGDLLGHKRPNSTFWYCKLAVADLRQVALELPGGGL